MIHDTVSNFEVGLLSHFEHVGVDVVVTVDFPPVVLSSNALVDDSVADWGVDMRIVNQILEVSRYELLNGVVNTTHDLTDARDDGSRLSNSVESHLEALAEIVPEVKVLHLKVSRDELLNGLVNTTHNLTDTGDDRGWLSDSVETNLEALAEVIPEVEVLELTILHGVEHHEIFMGKLTPLGLGEVLETVQFSLNGSAIPQIFGT